MEKIKIDKKTRVMLVIAFIAIYLLVSYISLRGQYLEYAELGEQYIEVFLTNIKYKYSLVGVLFVFLSTILYFTNRGIAKGLKPFFEQEGKDVPKLPNKSITLILAVITSLIVSDNLLEKILLFTSNASFGKTDIIFGLDISYYIFIKPLLTMLIEYFIKLVIAVSLYMAAYYIIVFNFCFKAVDRQLLRESKLIKKLLRNVIILAITVGLSTIIDTQNILTGTFLTLDNGVELTGAGSVEATIQLFGYIVFSFVIAISIILSVRYFKKEQNKKIMYTLLTIPGYLVALFIIMVGYDFIFVKPNEYDSERDYIKTNIANTQEAYGIEVAETLIDYTGTITEKEVQENEQIINNITLVSENLVLQSLKDTQTEAGYYTFRNVTLTEYEIDGKKQLVYVAPREIENQINSYNNKTYEYTHGIGQIVASATNVSEDGNVQYLQKDIAGVDNIYDLEQSRIYYGLETDSIVVTNTKNKTEYDYTDVDGIEHVYNYTGKSGIQVGFVDRLILAIMNGDIKLAMSNSVTDESRILTNRNIIERAKTVLPNLMYDESPYMIIHEKELYWVLDAYTISDKYPYSTYSEIVYEDQNTKINYIRNSAKVIINAYNGEMKFYITDRNDPIIMAYLKLYPTIFADKEIPEGIRKQLKYPEFLYNIQADMLKVYHNVREDVLYRNSDIWALAKYGTTSSKSKTANLLPYYALLKTPDNEEPESGLVQMYTQNGKSNITSYLVGTCNGTKTKLRIYKYPTDSNILGPIQLDNQITQDETISQELEIINVTGSKLSKEMKIIPINNTVLYVETIYQTRTNETNQPTTLEKVIVASGTKVAIGDTLEEAINNLLSQSAVNIDVNTTEDIDGIIEAIIRANKNLSDSNDRNDWEMMGTDIKELQSLIESLEKMIEKDDNKNATE